MRSTAGGNSSSSPLRYALIRLSLALLIIALANIAGYFFYQRFDLTSEKRYSLSPSTKKMMRGLKDVVTVKVYLAGDLNAGFTRLRESVRHTLDALRAYGGSNIQYTFIDPMAVENLDERKALITDLINRGIKPTNLTTVSNSDSKEQLIFPGATVAYGGREMPVQLLENQIGYSPVEIINNSIILLEYKFANAIKKLTQYRPPRIGFLRGHGELSEIELADIKQTLQQLHYEVKDFDITQNYYIPDRFDAIVIAKPRFSFLNPVKDKEEIHKFKIDQYIMRGGKVLWLIDGTNATMDSLRGNPTGQVVMANELGLEDMLFKYGVRINNDILQDINLNLPIPLVVGQMGNAPQTRMFSWYYFPLLVSDNTHPISRNLDPVAAFFASSIDTIKKAGIRKTILLHTTQNAKAQLTPSRVHFGILQGKPNPAYYNQSELPVAVLLEGKFESCYKNRMRTEYLAATDTIEQLRFIDQSPETKMIVISDGDIIRNEVRSDSTAFPLGYYPYTRQQFANKDFILNCIEYLTDNSGIIETRNKEVKLRLLDHLKAGEQKLRWQLINVAAPILLIVAAGFVWNWWRKKTYVR
ncbi:MAG: gliding motility-associated ABC transporter substrate-binding protein GldG [Chitinophagales bacterium]|nr:gliding motility-associated ABC transporter substrate-binding protein GldG [Chitinophagales bacterium]MDW8418683.1 gliding motility-associated ABC transporter substrate-binding protein GldG [Chitinophagales bacterium]